MKFIYTIISIEKKEKLSAILYEFAKLNPINKQEKMAGIANTDNNNLTILAIVEYY